MQVCIFAYGQTGSGKTHTMEGPAEDPGINVRALQELFRIAAEEGGEGSSWRVSVAMMEVYNDAVRAPAGGRRGRACLSERA
jgi:kinesin family protein C2/C3